MLTVIKLNNLLMYWVLFKTNDNLNDPSYIGEKFKLFFKKYPDNDNLFNLHWENQIIWNKGTDYMIKWKLNSNEFIKSDEYSRWLFTHYIVNSKKEYNEIKEGFFNGDENLYKQKFIKNDSGIFVLLSIYNLFFKSYDIISDNKHLACLLHPRLRQEYDQIVTKYKYFFRNVYINQLKTANYK